MNEFQCPFFPNERPAGSAPHTRPLSAPRPKRQIRSADEFAQLLGTLNAGRGLAEEDSHLRDEVWTQSNVQLFHSQLVQKRMVEYFDKLVESDLPTLSRVMSGALLNSFIQHDELRKWAPLPELLLKYYALSPDEGRRRALFCNRITTYCGIDEFGLTFSSSKWLELEKCRIPVLQSLTRLGPDKLLHGDKSLVNKDLKERCDGERRITSHLPDSILRQFAQKEVECMADIPYTRFSDTTGDVIMDNATFPAVYLSNDKRELLHLLNFDRGCARELRFGDSFRGKDWLVDLGAYRDKVDLGRQVGRWLACYSWVRQQRQVSPDCSKWDFSAREFIRRMPAKYRSLYQIGFSNLSEEMKSQLGPRLQR